MAAAAAAAKSLLSCPTLCDPIDGSPPGPTVPGILQAKNTGVGCHFLLQCMKAKSESEVTQSCLTLSDPMDRNLKTCRTRFPEAQSALFYPELTLGVLKVNSCSSTGFNLCRGRW